MILIVLPRKHEEKSFFEKCLCGYVSVCLCVCAVSYTHLLSIDRDVHGKQVMAYKVVVKTLNSREREAVSFTSIEMDTLKDRRYMVLRKRKKVKRMTLIIQDRS